MLLLCFLHCANPWNSLQTCTDINYNSCWKKQ